MALEVRMETGSREWRETRGLAGHKGNAVVPGQLESKPAASLLLRLALPLGFGQLYMAGSCTATRNQNSTGLSRAET